MKNLSNAATRIEGQQMFQVLAKAQELERQGKNIIHFEIGDPDFDTPVNIVDAACKALRAGDTHYTNSAGLFDYKKVAAEVTERSRGFKPDLDQILVTAGGNIQIYYGVACAVNPGEEVIIPDPSFVSYNSIIKFVGAKPVKIPLYEENEFRLNPEDVENAITDKTRMIIINSPSNPTGSVMTEEEIRRIYEIAEKYDVYLMSDEVYTRMIYKDSDTKFSSPSKYDRCKERTLVVHAFSKSYAMTGWRLGAVTGPAEIISKMGLLLETTSSCVSPFIQRAGIEALTGSQEPINRMVEEFRERRDIIVKELNKLPGIKCLKPKGAFYVFPNIKGTGLTSQEFADLMLEKAGVALCPGHYFGENGEGYVRLCYANSILNIKAGIQKMSEVLQKHIRAK
ncbi:MAG: pyridoxal phosphate-dependent aminotransferase [Syntrophales bacterium]